MTHYLLEKTHGTLFIYSRHVLLIAECKKIYFVTQIKTPYFVINVTKNQSKSTNTLAMTQNLFYHSKNEQSIVPTHQSKSELRLDE
ncbi:hypothetical protein B4903_07170 [Yersinia frederiksenii]|nr:hypothetical protein B4903_07170 [Yersinia frederiksenii]